ncbi:hypothetical protein SME46J_48450 (plasmid) [Serratia marcescens]|nr:hypothetical protein SME46J_48450 [Serratia marcescens]
MVYEYQQKKEPSAVQTDESDISELSYQNAAGVPGTSYSGEGLGRTPDSFFSFIARDHLAEAQEFRRKGHNSQVPEVDGSLLEKLQKAVNAAKSLVDGHVNKRSLLWIWLSEQIAELDRFINNLSGNTIQDWVSMSISAVEGTADKLGSRIDAQSMVRNLESTLQALTRVAQALGLVVDFSTAENLQRTVEDELISEVTNTFMPDDGQAVTMALEEMKAGADGNIDWSALVGNRVAAKEADKAAVFAAVITATRSAAKKAHQHASDLSGSNAQAFFRKTAEFLQDFSCKLGGKASLSNLPSLPERVQTTDESDESDKSDENEAWLTNKYGKIKLQVGIAVSVVFRTGRRGVQAALPFKAPIDTLDDSIIRSVLWQLQQPAIKLQLASQSILFKAKELKKINSMFSADLAAHDNEKITNSENSPNNLEEETVYTQLRKLIKDKMEQETPEGKISAKLDVLSQLFASDIDNAREIVKRFSHSQDSMESIKDANHHQFSHAITKMINEQFYASYLFERIREKVDKFLPDITKELAKSVMALKRVIVSAEDQPRNFSAIEDLAEKSSLLATNIKEKISTTSSYITGQPLDDNSRGVRLAKHWANLAKERGLNNWSMPDAGNVLAALSKHGLLEDIVSSGDPKGYLFATRLVGEFENARNDELKLPMSPDDYVALEKNLIDFIVRWGQKRTSRGTTRLIVELCFEQAVSTVTFNLSSVFRMSYKALKASIMIPYKMNTVNNYTMPGQDKPYKAIYSLLGKKLSQLGFKLITTPAPGIIKGAVGGGLTTMAKIYNSRVSSDENTVSAVYQKLAGGEKSKKIKMGSWAGMGFDVGLDAGVMSGFKGVHKALQKVTLATEGGAVQGEGAIPAPVNGMENGNVAATNEGAVGVRGEEARVQESAAPGEAADTDNGNEETAVSQRGGRNRREVNFDEMDGIDDSFRSQDFSPWRDNPGQSKALKFDDKYSFVGKTVKVIVTDKNGQQHKYNFSSNERSPEKAVKNIARDINNTISDVRVGEKVGREIVPIKSNDRNNFWVRSGSQLKVSYEVTYTLPSNKEVAQQREELKAKVTRLNNPILHHTQRMDDYLNAELKKNNISRNLDDYVAVRLVPNGGKSSPNLDGPKQPQPIVVHYKLRDVLTGTYLYDVNKRKDPLGRDYRATIKDQHAEFINNFDRTKLQEDLEKETDDYFTKEVKEERAGLLDNTVKARVVGYLANTDKQNEFYQCVSDFYDGKNPAKELYMNGVKVPGFFSFTVGQGVNSRTLVLNIYNDKVFVFKTKKLSRAGPGAFNTANRIIEVQTIESPSDWPAFNEAVIDALPLFEKFRYAGKPNPFKYQKINDIDYYAPISFKDGPYRDKLASTITDDIHKKTKDDYDTHIYSNTEEIVDVTLDMFRKYAALATVTTNIGALSAQGMATKALLFLVSLGIDVASAGAIFTQAHMADRSDKRDAMMNEGIWETVFIGIGVVGDTAGAAVTSYKALKPRIVSALKSLDEVDNLKPAKQLSARNAAGGSAPSAPAVAQTLDTSQVRYKGNKTKGPTPGLQTAAVPASLASDTAASAVQKTRKVLYNLDTNIEGASLLTAIETTNRPVRQAILAPSGNCESIMAPVGKFMKDNGFDDIKYRGMFIWENGTKNTIPSNHFVVTGKKNGQAYVFDLTAHQFENKGMPDLTGPLILSDQDWAAKYQGTTTRKRITYTDYASPSEASRNYNALPGHDPLTVKEGEQALTTPRWFETLRNSADPDIQKVLYTPTNVPSRLSLPGQSTSYTAHRYRDFQLLMPDDKNVTPNKLLISAHGSSIGETVRVPQKTKVYFYTRYGEVLVDRGLTSHQNKPLVRVSLGSTDVPDAKGGWRTATKDEMKELTGTTEPGQYKNMKLSHYEYDNPSGVMDTWRLEDSQPSAAASAERRPGIVTIEPTLKKSPRLSQISGTISPPSSGIELHVLACRETRWGAWRNTLLGNNTAGARATPVLPNRFSNVFSENSARNYTSSRPPTDAIGNVIIHATQNVSPEAKAVVATAGMTALGAGAAYYGLTQDSSSPYANAIDATLRSADSLKGKFTITLPDESVDLVAIQEHFFGKDNTMTDRELTQIVDWLRNVRLHASNTELRLFYNGEMTPRLQALCPVPSTLNRVSLRQLDLFFMFLDTRNKAPEQFTQEYRLMARNDFKDGRASGK